ncbi:hypothetical protein BSLA_02r4102 [Burkholderia stabilis]|nr:hypothetical protein BSLA_02r4102 [Burkholderia stabilis]
MQPCASRSPPTIGGADGADESAGAGDCAAQALNANAHASEAEEVKRFIG